MTDKIKANFYGANINQDIDEYVRSFDSCQMNKTTRHKKYGELLPLEVPYGPWTSISMDFTVGLPESFGFTKVWVIVDHFSKMAHFIMLPTVNKPEDLANLFLHSVWKHDGLPDVIVSDRDSKFISHFWQSLMDLLNVKLNISTPFDPQTDGQSDRVNQILEGYMRSYCSYQPDDWTDLLPRAQYAYNSMISAASKFSPFCANYGFERRNNWTNPKPSPEWDNPASEITISYSERNLFVMKENLAKTRLRITRWYNSLHQQGPEFSPCDEVMLDCCIVQAKRPMNKLDHKKFRPLKVKKAVGKRAFELELPPQMRIHPVFHIALLEPYIASTNSQRRMDPPETEEIGEVVNWTVREVIDCRLDRKENLQKVKYLVLWEGYEQDDETCETWENLKKRAEEALLDFHKSYPRKPRDARVVML